MTPSTDGEDRPPTRAQRAQTLLIIGSVLALVWGLLLGAALTIIRLPHPVWTTPWVWPPATLVALGGLGALVDAVLGAVTGRDAQQRLVWRRARRIRRIARRRARRGA